MKAAVYREHNKDPRKVVKIEDIEIPKIKDNQVLIKVEAVSYNYNDLWGIWGEPIKIPLPHISGSDVSGTVIDIGENVLQIKKGERIVGHPNLTCRICNVCTSGKEYDCSERQVWGFQTGPLWGGFAQYAYLPEVNVIKIPDNLSFQDYPDLYCQPEEKGISRLFSRIEKNKQLAIKPAYLSTLYAATVTITIGNTFFMHIAILFNAAIVLYF